MGVTRPAPAAVAAAANPTPLPAAAVVSAEAVLSLVGAEVLRSVAALPRAVAACRPKAPISRGKTIKFVLRNTVGAAGAAGAKAVGPIVVVVATKAADAAAEVKAAVAAAGADEANPPSSIGKQRRSCYVPLLTYLSSRDPSAGAGPVGIIKMEDQMQDEMRKALLDDKLGMRQLQVSVKPPARPAFGTLGTQTLIWANYVDIVKKKDVEIFRYDITVSPTIEGGKLRRVFELFLQDSRFDPYRGIIASDLHGILLAAKRLDFKAFTCDVAYRQEGEDTPQPDSTLYRVTATFKTSYRLNTLIEYLSGTTGFAASLPDKIDIVQAVQILIGNFSKMSTSLVTAQNKVYPIEDAQAAVDLQYGLKAVRGYFFSVRPATGRLLLNVNVSSGAFYNDGTLSFEGELLQDEDRALKTLLNKRWGTVIGNDDLHKLSSFLCKLKVSVTHLKKFNNSGREIPQVKVIQALANPMDGFRMEDNIKKKNMEKPPLVDHFGANAKDVQFYYEKKGRYVTVQEFFKGGESCLVLASYTIDHFLRVRSHGRPRLSCCEVRNSGQVHVSPSGRLRDRTAATVPSFAGRPRDGQNARVRRQRSELQRIVDQKPRPPGPRSAERADSATGTLSPALCSCLG